MNVRKFKLINNIGVEFDLTDIENGAFLNNPSGLGVTKNYNFTQINNTFLVDSGKETQTNIQGDLIFLTYDKYHEFINYIEQSNELSLKYTIPLEKSNPETYTKKVVMSNLGKTEKTKEGFLSCPVTFLGIGNWRKDVIFESRRPVGVNITRWEFPFEAYLSDFNNNEYDFVNSGHKEAEFTIEISGGATNLTIIIEDEKGNQITNINIPQTIPTNAVFKYSTVDGNNYIYYENSSGKINLFQNLDITKRNFTKLPKGYSKIKVSSDTEIQKMDLKIYPEHVSV